MTTERVFLAFCAFILLLLTGIAWWMRRTQAYFDAAPDDEDTP